MHRVPIPIMTHQGDDGDVYVCVTKHALSYWRQKGATSTQVPLRSTPGPGGPAVLLILLTHSVVMVISCSFLRLDTNAFSIK